VSTIWGDGNPDRNRVGKLRTRGAPEGGRGALVATLASLDLRPSGMPRNALLLVRRMRVALPRDDRVGAHLEHETRAHVDALYRQASRQDYAGLDASAQALYFADEAELLACLLNDVVAGRASGLWWWRRLLGSATPPTSAALPAILHARAMWVPSALARLARAGRATPVVAALSPDAASRVMRAVTDVHDLPLIAAALERTSAIGAAATPPSRHAPARGRAAATATIAGRSPGRFETTPPARPDGAGVARSSAVATPPWQGLLPAHAVAGSLDVAQACLLATALVVHHRPEVARGTRYARQLAQWWTSSVDPGSHRPARKPAGPMHQGPPARHEAAANAPRTIVAPPTPRRDDGTMQPTSGQQALAAATAGAGAPSFPAPATRVPIASGLARPNVPAGDGDDDNACSAHPLEPRIGAIAPDLVASTPHGAVRHREEPATYGALIDGPRPALPADDAIEPTTSETRTMFEGGVDTRFGGVLFLINLMLALDLPECLERDWRVASGLGPWALLRAIARALLAGEPGAAGDAVWQLLYTLAGDAGTGARLRRDGPWRLPAAWRPATCTRPTWSVHGPWLRLWSPDGIVLSEVRRDGRPAQALADAEAIRHGIARRPARAFARDVPRDDPAGPLALPHAPALRRLLGLMLPALRWRLARALGREGARPGLVRALLARPACLYATSTHVDVVLPMDAVSLPVRIAGLDRSPGWLPAFGRVVQFHFE
jgi:hypothetical protein